MFFLQFLWQLVELRVSLKTIFEPLRDQLHCLHFVAEKYKHIIEYFKSNQVKSVSLAQAAFYKIRKDRKNF